jgi:hypothetical protein
MIWDTFLFADELDLLEVRLKTLDQVVDRFVLVEAPVAHSGMPKALYYEDNRARFARWHDRIIHRIVYGLPGGVKGCEAAQRAWCWPSAEHGARPDDTVLHGDVDEIPAPADVAVAASDGRVVFRQRMFLFAVDWLHPDPWYGTVALPYGDGTAPDFRALRTDRPWFNAVDGGWHLSWLGGPAAITRKTCYYGHPEHTAAIREANYRGLMYERGWCPWDEVQMAPADVDSSWPSRIANRECPPQWFRPRP